MARKSKTEAQKSSRIVTDVAEAKKEIMRMRFRRALGESVSSHRFREVRRSIACALSLERINKMRDKNA